MADGADVLRRIVSERREDARQAGRLVAEAELRERASLRRHRSLRAALARHQGPAVIAEMKQASPSAGRLVDTYDPAGIARAYEAAGAVGLSVLTEPRHFLGDLHHLELVRDVVALPILRKDFICDAYQVAEAAAWGSDVVLLIVAGLTPEELVTLYRTATEVFGLDVLVEAHTEAELTAALRLDDAIIGINSRDLRTLSTDLAVAHRLASLVGEERLSIAESGIKTGRHLAALGDAGYDGFLIGESLLRGGDPGGALARLLADAAREERQP